MDQRCPNCRLINPAGAVRCDCGWDFARHAQPAALAEMSRRKYQRYARRSWAWPAMAFACQVVFMLVLNVAGEPAPIGMWLVLLQGIAFMLGLYFGLKAVLDGWRSLSKLGRFEAVFGLVVCGGMTAVFLIVSVVESF
jgi:hypothetical protein